MASATAPETHDTAMMKNQITARRTGLALYALRLTGAVLFEVTQVRQFFFVGANIFENFYIYVAGRLEIDAKYRIKSLRRPALILLFVGAPKILQEP